MENVENVELVVRTYLEILFIIWTIVATYKVVKDIKKEN